MTQVGNTGSFTYADWQSNFKLAIEAKIDGFAMNMAQKDTTNDAQLTVAFDAANALGFKLFFSFDYASNGLWDLEDVVTYIQRFSGNTAYFRDRLTNKPLVSTFEGPVASANWTSIRARTGCFFIPSWNSLTPSQALSKGVADGLFNWDAWPAGKNDMVC